MAVVEEPDLGQDERRSDHRDRRDARSAGDEQDERDQPDDVLRRDEAVEGEKPGDRGGRGQQQAFGAPRAAREEEPDEGDGRELEDRAERGERVRERARRGRAWQLRSCRGRRSPRRRRAGAPRAGTPRRGSRSAGPATTGRGSCPRARPGRGSANGRITTSTTPARTASDAQSPGPARDRPDVQHRERDEDERVELRRDRQAEEPEREELAAPEKGGQRADGQRGREQVVGVQRDRPDRDRRQREEPGRGVEPAPAQPRSSPGSATTQKSAAIPQSAISVLKAALYAPPGSTAGGMKTANAPGGYSTKTSR